LVSLRLRQSNLQADSCDALKRIWRWFRVDLLGELPADVGRLLYTYRQVIEAADDGRDKWKKLRAMNQLDVTRGTIQLV
jgi:putative protease